MLLSLMAVVAGRALDTVIPERPHAIVVGVTFLVFAWMSWRGEEGGDNDEAAPRMRIPLLGSFGVVAASFFLAELGDKTQLTTLSLAGTQPSFAGVWLGSTAGIVLADAVAIAVGLALGKHLPRRAIGRAAAVLFVLFGVGIIVRAFM